MSEEQRSEVMMTAKREYAEGHRVFPCTGLIGGITPSGELRVDAYVNLGVTPDQLTVEILHAKGDNDDGDFNEEATGPKIPELRRVIQTTLLIPGSHIGAVADFFREQVERREQMSSVGESTITAV